jgi:hypothetical protein
LGARLEFRICQSETLDAELTVGLQTLDKNGADTWDHAARHSTAADMAAAAATVDLAQQQASIALEMGRSLCSPTTERRSLQHRRPLEGVPYPPPMIPAEG